MSYLEEAEWFVIKVRFNRAISAQKQFTKYQIETYFPMEMRNVVVKNGKSTLKLMPVFSNLIFAKATLSRIFELCAVHKDWYYLSNIENGLRRAVKIPESQMKQFIGFIDGNFEGVEYKLQKFKGGKKFIVQSGIFKNSEVIFKEERGKTNKRYIVEVNGQEAFFSQSSFDQDILGRID